MNSNRAQSRSYAHVHLPVIKTLAKVLDTNFSFFGFRFGFDPLIGLIPGIGDVITLLLSCYLILAAVQLNIPREAIGRMITNIVFDFLLGLIPFIGDASDFVFRANAKNIKILQEHIHVPSVEGEIVE